MSMREQLGLPWWQTLAIYIAPPLIVDEGDGQRLDVLEAHLALDPWQERVADFIVTKRLASSLSSEKPM